MADYSKPVPGVAFSGPNRFLSNMYPANISLQKPVFKFPEACKPYWMHFLSGDIVFKSTEHAYQACKSGDPGYADLILSQDKAVKTKMLAHKLIPSQFSLMERFHDNKVELMRWLNYEKFYQNKHLADKLLATSGEIVEENTWGDTFWGVSGGKGKNMLGKILMEVRDSLRFKKKLGDLMSHADDKPVSAMPDNIRSAQEFSERVRSN